MEPSPPIALAGRSIPGGTFRLAAHENWLAHYAFYSTPEERPHPLVAFIASQRGMGLGVDELFEIFDFNIQDGPLLAECVLDYHYQLREEVDYEIKGVVTSAERKRGRKLGEFDLVTCVFNVIDPRMADVPAATVTNVYALPRRGSD